MSTLDGCAPLTVEARKMLRMELERYRLSARGYHRVRRVARTLADLDPVQSEVITAHHVVMALQLRIQVIAEGRAA